MGRSLAYLAQKEKYFEKIADAANPNGVCAPLSS
jgi:hypothetical protein